MKKLGQFLKAYSEAADELEAAEQKVSNQCYIDLRKNGIGGVADKGFDLVVLLDEAEEGLDLPALLVDAGDGPGGEVEIAGREDVMLSGLPVAVADPPECGRIIGPFRAGQPDGLIGGYTQTAVDSVASDGLVTSVNFHPDDEENALFGQGISEAKAM